MGWVVAIADFVATAPDELSFSTGAEIEVVRQIDGNWYEGTLRGRTGIFPVPFVKHLSQPTTAPAAASKPQVAPRVKAGTTVKAISVFTSDQPDELALQVGDVVTVTAVIDEAWLKGILKGKTGIFPKSFVEVTQDAAHDAQPHAIAKFDFTGQALDELTFFQGDKIVLLSVVDQAWMTGTTRNHTGLFPADFVDVIVPLPQAAKAAPATSSAKASASTSASASTKSTASSTTAAATAPAAKAGPAVIATARATFAYESEEDGDLRFRQGDTIEITEKIDDNWYRGRIAGAATIGLFPSGFVEIVKPSGKSRQASFSAPGEHRASFTADEARKMFVEINGTIAELQAEIERDEKAAEQELQVIREGKQKAPAPNTPQSAALVAAQQRASRLQFQIAQKELSLQSLLSERNNLMRELGEDLELDSARQDSEQSLQKLTSRRAHVINELISTEKEYLQDLKLCVKGYLNNAAALQQAHIDVETLFGNFKEVVEVSSKLSDQLAAQMKKGDTEQSIGVCFVNLKTELEAAYVTYCCHFPTASALLQTYQENAAAKDALNSCQASINAYTNSWELDTFLIKPFQRVLKYPLLLREALSATQKTHFDHALIQQASDIMAHIASEINEKKRQDELLSKYSKEVKEGGPSLDKVNWHSVEKKTMRLGQIFFNTVKTKEADKDDLQFVELDQHLAHVALAVYKFRKRLTEHVESVQANAHHYFSLLSAVREYYSNTQLNDVIEISQAVVQQITLAYVDYLNKYLIDAMADLLKYFETPQFLIDKRKDKRLDYESYKRKLASTKDAEKRKLVAKDLELAKSNYEAINDQLMEQLPKLNHLADTMLSRFLRAFFRKHEMYFEDYIAALTSVRSFDESEQPQHCRLPHSERLAYAMEVFGTALTNQRIFTTLQTEILKPDDVKKGGSVARLSTGGVATRTSVDNGVPETPKRPATQTTATTQPKQAQTSSAAPAAAPVAAPRQVPAKPAGRVLVCILRDIDSFCSPCQSSYGFAAKEKRPAVQEMFAICQYDFRADNPTEIDVAENAYVTVVQQYDLKGNKEWWLIKRQDGVQGYVPANYLQMVSI
eukprot:m.724510 g.724510  ORF g.724510 m.724510 type:complete len:1075 (+) comp58836_c0_seq2:32-3256(+)